MTDPLDQTTVCCNYTLWSLLRNWLFRQDTYCLLFFFFEAESLPVALNSDHPASVLQELGFQIAWPIQKGLNFHETF